MNETKQIRLFIHCYRCHKEKREPKVEVGITPIGLQVWCVRHQMEVGHYTPEFLEEHLHNSTCECCNKKEK